MMVDCFVVFGIGLDWDWISYTMIFQVNLGLVKGFFPHLGGGVPPLII
jgi:hypothetical protein